MQRTPGQKKKITPEAREMGQRLQQLRRERGVKQRDVAERLGLTVGAYGHFEQGRSRIASIDLRALAAALGVGLPLLLRRLGIMDASDRTDVEQIVQEFLTMHPDVRVYFARIAEYDSDDAATLLEVLRAFDHQVERNRERRRTHG